VATTLILPTEKALVEGEDTAGGSEAADHSPEQHLALMPSPG
jgi:hypothetical protein